MVKAVSTHAIDIAGVSKAYRRGATVTTVLTDIELCVSRGECVFLAGPSGSGKTTLLSIIGCILSHDRGRVSVLGQDLQMLPNRKRPAFRLARIGFVFQRFQLVRGLTALENVCVPLTLRGTRAGLARRRGLALLDAVGIAAKAHEHPATLSTGQCQRVALARALAGEPELILADEPTAALDAENGWQTMQLLRNLAKEHGKTAIVVTHDSRIFPFADRIHWLENGKIIRSCEPEQFLALASVHETSPASDFPLGAPLLPP